MAPGNLLIDVSRLIWRVWSGRLPTGIDRVCLAYLEHFGADAQAVVQWRGHVRVLAPGLSRRLFALLREGGPRFRPAFRRIFPAIVLSSSGRDDDAGRIYLNIGHTGLNAPALPRWIARRRLKAVFLVHDLIPILHPEFARVGEAERHERRIRNVLACAAGVIGNSRATIDDLGAFAHRHALPVPASIDAWISGHELSGTVPVAGLDRPWFVIVSTIEGRKNHAMLLQMWQRLVRRMGAATPLLVIVGQRGWEAELATALLDRGEALDGHVLELARCGDEELAGLIAGARALLMPSFAEGFGLPVIEALQLGTPVIVSDLPVFHEIAGDIATFIDPADSFGWERAILEFLGDGNERARQLAAMAGYRGPTWPDHFARITPWLASL